MTSCLLHSILAKQVSIKNELKKRSINFCTYLFVFLSKGHNGALNSEETISLLAKNFLYHIIFKLIKISEANQV